MRLNKFVCECGNIWFDVLHSDECVECNEYCFARDEVEVIESVEVIQ